MENTFWHINGDGNFVELFKKSFKLYVESGMEADILRNASQQGGHLMTKDDCNLKAEFYMFITGHYLRKIHCFFLHLTHLIT
jgi:hypothetical protein